MEPKLVRYNKMGQIRKKFRIKGAALSRDRLVVDDFLILLAASASSIPQVS